MFCWFHATDFLSTWSYLASCQPVCFFSLIFGFMPACLLHLFVFGFFSACLLHSPHYLASCQGSLSASSPSYMASCQPVCISPWYLASFQPVCFIPLIFGFLPACLLHSPPLWLTLWYPYWHCSFCSCRFAKLLQDIEKFQVFEYLQDKYIVEKNHWSRSLLSPPPKTSFFVYPDNPQDALVLKRTSTLYRAGWTFQPYQGCTKYTTLVLSPPILESRTPKGWFTPHSQTNIFHMRGLP